MYPAFQIPQRHDLDPLRYLCLYWRSGSILITHSFPHYPYVGGGYTGQSIYTNPLQRSYPPSSMYRDGQPSDSHNGLLPSSQHKNDQYNYYGQSDGRTTNANYSITNTNTKKGESAQLISPSLLSVKQEDTTTRAPARQPVIIDLNKTPDESDEVVGMDADESNPNSDYNEPARVQFSLPSKKSYSSMFEKGMEEEIVQPPANSIKREPPQQLKQQDRGSTVQTKVSLRGMVICHLLYARMRGSQRATK